jgi:hypothetical protein
MKTRLMTIFALAFAAFFILPAFLDSPFPPYPLMKVGDVFDLLTPLVLIPLYWVIFAQVLPTPPKSAAVTAFLLLAALWVLGQGAHLAANSIGHQLEELKATDAYTLTYFYDEVLSHYLWHLGVFGLSALLMVIDARSSDTSNGRLVTQLPAALIYGFTFFLIIIEGQTWPVGLPFAVIAGVAPLVFKRRELSGKPVLGAFTLAHLIALILTVGWWIYWGEPIEFSAVGII